MVSLVKKVSLVSPNKYIFYLFRRDRAYEIIVLLQHLWPSTMMFLIEDAIILVKVYNFYPYLFSTSDELYFVSKYEARAYVNT